MPERPSTRPRRPLSDLQKEGAKGLNLDKLLVGIPRKKDGTYTPQNQKRRHDALAAYFQAKGDEEAERALEATLPPARACNFCGEDKREFRTIKIKGEPYRICKDCEDSVLITGEPLGMPTHLDDLPGSPDFEEEEE